MTIPNNDQRAEWARAAVEEFRDVCRGSPLDDQDGWDEACGDLVSDLMHLIAKEGLDPIEVVRRGVCMYLDERDYPPDGWAPDDQRVSVYIEALRGVSFTNTK